MRDAETDQRYAAQTVKLLGALLREELPPGIGFAVQLFALDPEPCTSTAPHWGVYAASAERVGVAAVLRRMADDLEAGGAHLCRDGQVLEKV